MGKSKGKDMSEEMRKRLIAVITLLSTLNTEPGRPTENEAPGDNRDHRGYQLSFDKERRLAEDFACLAATTDDGTKVMAVSVEEDPDERGLTIRLASNTGDLSGVKEGFERILSVLQQILRDGSSAPAEDTLLREIIRLDYYRILSRLRSCHLSANRSRQRRNGGPSSIVLLARLVGAISSSLHQFDNGPDAIRPRVQNLSETFHAFEATVAPRPDSRETQNALLDIIKQSHTIAADRSFQVALAASAFPDSNMKKSVASKIRKIGRYHAISRYLIKDARNLKQLFSRITIAFLLPSATPPPGPVTFEYALQCVSESQVPGDLRSAIAAYKKKSITSVQDDFDRRLLESTTRWKVHAEIKLLLYYESHNGFRAPRVICSSKKACYLCDLFIKNHHGKYFMPRTHGKLYDKWTLPPSAGALSNTNSLLMQRCIEQTILDIEAKIVALAQDTWHPPRHPNESFSGVSEPWSLTASGCLMEPGRGVQTLSHEVCQDSGTTGMYSPLQNNSVSTLRGAGGEGIETRQSARGLSRSPATTSRFSSSLHSLESQSYAREGAQLIRGTPLSCRIEQAQSCIELKTNAMNIKIAWDGDDPKAISLVPPMRKACCVQVLWCHSFDPIGLHDSEVVDLSAIEHSPIKTEAGAALNARDLMIRKGNEALKIKFTFSK